MEHLTDEQLVARTVSGEEEAFRMLVRRHQHYIFTLLLGMVGQRETAEDLAQEVFLRLYRSLDRFRGDAKFTTWLYRVAVNIVTDYRRAQRRRPVTALLDRIKRRLAGSGDEQPEQLAVAREERSHLQRAIERLPDKYRLVLYLYHYKQLSYQEVAEVLQLPPKTVETRLYRGKALLKQQWLEVTGNDETAAAKPGTGARFLARPDGVGRIHGAGDGGRSDGTSGAPGTTG